MSYARRWQLSPTERILMDELLRYGDLTDHERDRLHILLWLDGGKGWRQIIRESGISADMISRTICNYRTGGLEGVLFPSYGEKAADIFQPTSNSRFRALLPELLRLTRAAPPLSYTEIGARLGLHRSSVCRLCLRLGIHKTAKRRKRSVEGRQRQIEAVRAANQKRFTKQEIRTP